MAWYRPCRRVGSFLLYPAVTAKGEYDSNIFALDKNFSAIIDDFILVVSPEVVLESNWNRHQLNFWAAADFGFYTPNSTEDFEDFEIPALPKPAVPKCRPGLSGNTSGYFP